VNGSGMVPQSYRDSGLIRLYSGTSDSPGFASILYAGYHVLMMDQSGMLSPASLRQRLKPFCEKHHIRRLEVFDSVARAQARQWYGLARDTVRTGLTAAHLT